MNRAIRSAVVATAIGSMIACGSNPVEPPPPANIAGSYDMTVTASSTCSATLPADAREFKSIADITQTEATFKATLVGHVIFVSVSVSGSVSDNRIRIPRRRLARPERPRLEGRTCRRAHAQATSRPSAAWMRQSASPKSLRTSCSGSRSVRYPRRASRASRRASSALHRA